MLSASEDMKIQCSESTFDLLSKSESFYFSMNKRRDGDSVGVQIKGKGVMLTWWLNAAYPNVRRSSQTDSVSYSGG